LTLDEASSPAKEISLMMPILVKEEAPIYAASVIVGLAAQHADRSDLIRSPKRVLAHLWEGESEF